MALNFFIGQDYDDWEYDSSPGPINILDEKLRHAVRNDKLATASELLSQGANANTLDRYGESATQLAVGIGAPMLELLLKNGANANDRFGAMQGNVIQRAARSGKPEILELLLTYGVDINLCSGLDGTALMTAANRGDQDTVRFLLSHGADVNIKGGQYETALEAGAYYGNQTVVKMLLDAGAEVNAQGGYCGDALTAAARYGHNEVVTMLLNAGADVHFKGGVDGGALKAAKERGFPETVKLIERAIVARP